MNALDWILERVGFALTHLHWEHNGDPIVPTAVDSELNARIDDIANDPAMLRRVIIAAVIEIAKARHYQE